jgi:hypothetical protein
MTRLALDRINFMCILVVRVKASGRCEPAFAPRDARCSLARWNETLPKPEGWGGIAVRAESSRGWRDEV